MKKRFSLMAVFCLLLTVVAISAQDKTVNFVGDWTLDKDKSELGERSRIESMTMKVSQTDKELTFERKTKRAERSDGEGRGGRGRRGMRGGNQQPMTYNLEGKETEAQMGSGRFAGKAKLKANMEKDGKLKLTQTRSFETPRGAVTIKNIETWELSDDGKMLTVSSEIETPRGNRSSKMVFTKS